MNRALAALIVTALLCGAAFADVKLPSVLSDNMVLQHSTTIPIWGKADAGEKVSVTLGKASAQTSADDKGYWKVAFEPLAASDKPIEMTVTGKNTVKVGNILVGEVWVCSGQSNMAMKVSDSNDAQKEIAAGEYPLIRLMSVPQVRTPQPQADVPARWVACSPKTVGSFSAAAYFFGRHIHKELKVPVGLINSSWGGSPVEAWTPMETYKKDPALSEFPAIIEKETNGLPASMEAYKAKADQWKASTQAIAASQPGAKTPPPPPAVLDPKEKYGGMYNAMIAPLTPYPIAGVIWYQGEANAQKAMEYRRQFPAMIRAWRQAWRTEFPFLYVQLANNMPRTEDPNAKSSWAELREAQTMALATPRTGMAITLDTAGDAGSLHPKDKQAVGLRLAVAAMAVAYGKKDVAWQGPIFDSMKADGDKLIVKFKNADGGLVNKGDVIEGFAIAGADGKYSWAQARIDGDSVTLTSKDVPKPAAVRFIWASNPKCTLYNKAGLPACPFRAGEEGSAPAGKEQK